MLAFNVNLLLGDLVLQICPFYLCYPTSTDSDRKKVGIFFDDL